MRALIVNAGLADRVLPLSMLGPEIVRRVREGRVVRPAMFVAGKPVTTTV